MNIIKAILSTIDFLLIVIFLSVAIAEKEDKSVKMVFSSLSLLIGSNILLLWR